ncbi:MAG: hypothetical protein JWQ38_1102 [Flavipsychrobacter sp.]|nr:hypothetical protein [Flavipsychrobacter sp.]
MLIILFFTCVCHSEERRIRYRAGQLIIISFFIASGNCGTLAIIIAQFLANIIAPAYSVGQANWN